MNNIKKLNLGRLKQRLPKIICGAVVYLAALLVGNINDIVALVLFIAALLIAGGGVIWSAVKNIFRGQIFDENLLMSLASIGAMLIGEYPEAVAVMLFYQVGEYFQDRAVKKSRQSITDLMDIRPDYAHVLREGQVVTIDPEDVLIDEIIIIRPGEKVPLDAVVVEGYSQLDTSALSGESLPREISIGDTVLSGCININGLLTAKVSKEFAESTVSKILELVENASSNKSVSENFITKFARYYTPIVVAIAALLAIVPPLVLESAIFSDWLYRALVFLVISCPCALVISVPLSFFGGIGAASKNGVLIKGSNYLEVLAKVDTIVFDKTGTLTKGVFKVQQIHPYGISTQELLKTAAYAESCSNHPISLSLREAWGQKIDSTLVTQAEEIQGQGIISHFEGQIIHAGNAKLMATAGIDLPALGSVNGTIVHIAINNSYAGYILIADQIRADAAQAIQQLAKLGIRKTVMLTGDSKLIGEQVAQQLGISQVYSELLPADKVAKMEELLAASPHLGKVAFVGDGINDAPVLARADIGIAMGGLGADAAIEAADIVIMTDEPSKIALAIKIAKHTLGIAKQNIVFALGIKIIVLVLGALGLASMWAAVFADVGVSVLAILNAIRVLTVKSFT